MLPSAISRRATTVGLSFSQGTVGSAPLARRRARCAASSTSWKMFSTFGRQSSTVIRAMSLSAEQAAGRSSLLEKHLVLPGFAVQDALSASRTRHAGPSGQQLGEQGLQVRSIRPVTGASPHDLEQLFDSGLEVLVDDDPIEFRVMRHIRNGIPETPCDDFLAVGLAIAQARFELAA